MSNLMTTNELAEYLHLNRATIQKHAKDGVIPGIRIGRVWRFRQDTIDEWLGAFKTVCKEPNAPQEKTQQEE